MPSSVIRSMRYNPAERTLDIEFQKAEFRDGPGVYRYFDVPAAEWTAFRAASSKGTYLNQVFKEGGYGYEKIACSSQSALSDGELVWGEWANRGPEPHKG